MKLKDRLNADVCYFAFSLDSINADPDVALEANWGYARVLNPLYIQGYSELYLLCGVYDFFTEKLTKDIRYIREHDFIMNQMLCFAPKVRGVNKWSFLGSEPVDSLKMPLNLPDMTNALSSDPKNLVTYYRNGVYLIFPGIGQKIYKTAFENVSHLESTEMRTHENIILELYAELLKNTNKQLSDEELLRKFINFGEGEKEWLQFSDREKDSYFNAFKLVYQKVAYKSIPAAFRERAKNEIPL